MRTVLFLTTANQGGAIPADIQGTHPVLVSLKAVDQSTSLHIPGANGFVLPAAKQVLTIGAKGHRAHPAIVSFHLPQAATIGKRSQRRMTLSLLTLANRVLLGQAATQRYPGLMAINLVELVSRRQMPDP